MRRRWVLGSALRALVGKRKAHRTESSVPAHRRGAPGRELTAGVS